MTRQPHERSGESSIERARREGGDASYLHGAVEGLVILAKPLIVRAIARLMYVEQRDDEPRSRIVTTDAACRLDVLCMRFWLAQHDHQPEARDIEAHGDHVRGN